VAGRHRKGNTSETRSRLRGIVVNESGKNNNSIYRNTFDHISRGIQAQGRNGDRTTVGYLITGQTGLVNECNVFATMGTTSDDYDMGITQGSSAYAQINYLQARAALSLPAGNIFSQNITGTLQHDYYTYSSLNSDVNAKINYYFDTPSSQWEPRSTDITPVNILKTQVSIGNACISTLGAGHIPYLPIQDLQLKVRQFKNKIDSIYSLDLPDSVLGFIIPSYKYEINLLESDIIRCKLNDNMYQEKTDTLINNFKYFETTMDTTTGKRDGIIAGLYIDKEDYVNADSLITVLGATAGKQNLSLILSIYKELKQNGKTIDYIATDSVLKYKLLTAANDSTDEGYLYAISILQQLFGNTYYEPIDGVNHNQDKRMVLTHKKEEQSSTLLYPNPNNGEMTLIYNLGGKETGELRILDVTGRLIEKYELQNTKNTLAIKQLSLQSGVYLYQILVNDKITKSDRLIILK